MFVIMGASGHIGGGLAAGLLKKGHKVRVLGRSAERLQSLVDQGAEACPGDQLDAAFLHTAFTGAAAAFVMIPPNMGVADFRAWQKLAAESITQGLAGSGVKRVIALSSVGADLAEGTGPIVGVHYLEQGLNTLPALELTHLRPAYFIENTLNSIGLIKHAGIMASTTPADHAMPMIATRDIAAAALEEILSPTAGDRVRYLLGAREYSSTEVAHILGAAIGRPDLAYHTVDAETVRGGMLGASLSADLADLYLEMLDAFNSGRITAPARDTRNTTPTKLEDFAPVFAQAFNA